MKFTITLLTLVCVFQVSFSQNNKNLKLKKGSWIAELHLNQNDDLPFDLVIEKEKKSYHFFVINGDERITLDSPQIINDSVHVRFPYFNSVLVFKIHTKKRIKGYWQNFNKGDNYRIPFESSRKKGSRFSFISKKSKCIQVAGRWEVEFEPNTNSSYPAIGVFEQEQNSNVIQGTFLTETGDYRFLEGNCVNDSIYLSCFDGSHAFLFKAHQIDDTLKGQFYSGSHWHSEWEAVRNENAALRSPEDLTYLKDSSAVVFELKNLNGSLYQFPSDNTKDKVVIIQIMGSWCPNCLDETIYYKSLYDKYHNQGLEIISVCYEAGKTFEDYVRNIERLKNKLSLEFTFLVGGNAQKKLASEHFNMLNEVISFPTSIIIGRDGEVKRIHTGFNGPGTGVYYDEYVEKTNALLEYLLAQ